MHYAGPTYRERRRVRLSVTIYFEGAVAGHLDRRLLWLVSSEGKKRDQGAERDAAKDESGLVPEACHVNLLAIWRIHNLVLR